MLHIIFLHGALGSASQLSPLISYFQSLYPEVKCHVLEFTGHGKKAAQNKDIDFSIQQFSNDLLSYILKIDKKPNDKICVFGYSMGGYAALNLLKTHQDIIDRLFTLGTKFNWNEESSKAEVKHLEPDKIESKIPKFAEALKERHSSAEWKNVLSNTAKMMLELGRAPLLQSNDLKNIDCNVRICVGDSDNMVTIEESEKASRDLKNGSLLVLPETLHPIEKVDIKKLCHEIHEFFK